MKNSKKPVRLYNLLIAPLWMCCLIFPIFWLVSIPAYFIINSLVLVVAMHALKLENKKQLYKNNILKVFAFGVLSYIVASAFMWLMLQTGISLLGDELYLTIPALIISATLIFVFDYFISFKKLDKSKRLKLALAFSITTAPYVFLISTSWIML